MNGDVKHCLTRGEEYTDILPLVYKQWNKESNFIIGVNFVQESGDVWTSLGLKREVKKLLQVPKQLQPLTCDLRINIFRLVPIWLAQAFHFYELEGKIQSFVEGTRKDRCLILFTKGQISFRDFIKLFSIVVTYNMDLHLYNNEMRDFFQNLSLEEIKSWRRENQSLFLSDREGFYSYIEEIGRGLLSG